MRKNLIITVVLIIFIIFFLSHISLAQKYFSYEESIFLNNNVYSMKELIYQDFFPIEITEDALFDGLRRRTFIFKPFNFDLFFSYFTEKEVNLRTNNEAIKLLMAFLQQQLSPGLEYENIEAEMLYEERSGFSFGGKIWGSKNDTLKFYLNSRIYTIDNYIYYNYSDGFVKILPDGKYSIKVTEKIKDPALTLSWEDDFYSYGYGLDYCFIWQINQNNLLHLEVINFKNKLYLYNLHAEEGEIDTSLSVQPGGRYWYEDHVIELTPEYNLSYNYRRLELGVLHKEETYPYGSFALFDNVFKLRVGKFADFYTFNIGYNPKYLDVEGKLYVRDLSSPFGAMGQVAIRMLF